MCIIYSRNWDVFLLSSLRPPNVLTNSFNSDVLMFWRQRRNTRAIMTVLHMAATSQWLVDPRYWCHLIYESYCIVKHSSGSWTHNTLVVYNLKWFLQTETLLCCSIGSFLRISISVNIAREYGSYYRETGVQPHSERKHEFLYNWSQSQSTEQITEYFWWEVIMSSHHYTVLSFRAGPSGNLHSPSQSESGRLRKSLRSQVIIFSLSFHLDEVSSQGAAEVCRLGPVPRLSYLCKHSLPGSTEDLH